MTEPGPVTRQNQTIFGVPIPFTRKTDRTDKYHKVPTDSDNGHSSDEDPPAAAPSASAQPNGAPNGGEEARDRNASGSSNYSSTISPTPSSTENLTDPFSSVPFNKSRHRKPAVLDAAAQQPIKVESCPVALLPNNPFLSDIIQGNEGSGGTGPSGDTAPEVNDVVTNETLSRPDTEDGFHSLPRLPKSRTVDGLIVETAEDRGGSMKRSQTDYFIERSDSDTLLDEARTNSLRKKEKGRKSPRGLKVKSPRGSGTKKSLAYDEEENGGYEGVAITNEGFSEQDTPRETISHPQPAPRPQPPTLPKPSERKAPKTKPVELPSSSQTLPHQTQPPKPSVPPKPSPSTIPNSDIVPGTKDFYKTHKRYSSYDIATGRAQLTVAEDTDSKSALVTKEGGKPKKKNKIGLSLF